MRRVVCGQLVLLAAIASARAQVVVGQDGKDVVYLPTPAPLVEKMLDLAGVMPQDVVVDLGSGDGRIVIAAAKRGARALGIEYDAELVALSRRSAAAEGVGERATFLQADLFEADFSQATIVTTFLLADLMLRVAPKILDLAPGSRLVSNSFTIEGWTPDDAATVPDCATWCTAYLWIVPAKIDGTWRSADGEISLTQNFQMLSGTYTSGAREEPIVSGLVRGDRVSFAVGGRRYEGRIAGDVISGAVVSGEDRRSWSATRREAAAR